MRLATAQYAPECMTFVVFLLCAGSADRIVALIRVEPQDTNSIMESGK